MPMVRVWWVAGVVALGLSSGCDGGAVCSFNSDCAAGSFCDEDGVCRSECSESAPCPTGEQCTSFGQCVAGPGVDGGPADGGGSDDGGPGDAGPGDAGPGDAGPGDAGPGDAGPPEEVCTPSTTGSVPSDEDGDGAIDEGCGWHFGVPHAVTAAHPSDDLVAVTGISADGLRLWMTAPRSDGTRGVFVSERAALDAPFTAAREVTAALGITNPAITTIAMSADELEIIYDDDWRTDAGSDMYRATRTSVSVPFGAAEPIAALNTAGAVRDYAPRLSADGLEIFFTRLESGARSMWRARRASRTASFEAPVAIAVPGGTDQEAGATPSQDGRTLFFVRDDGGGFDILRTGRSDPATLELVEPVAVPELASGGYSIIAALSERTREVFVFSTRAWSPGATYGVWRAEICRDGPCPERVVACPPPGSRSPDGVHCYFVPGASEPFVEASALCAASDAHLVTLNSAAETSFVLGLVGGGFWTAANDRASEGVWRWDWPERTTPEEPFVNVQWGHQGGFPVEPIGGDAHDCATHEPGFTLQAGLNDRSCENDAPIACERELWPTW